MKLSDAEICRARVAQSDRDRYLSVLYAPENKRAHLFALYAFNAEVAEITARVREALPGEIRLQWWRDVLTGGAYSGEGVPLANALLQTITDFKLPPAAFEAYLDARIGDLYADPFPDRTELEAYCGQTASATIQLACLILDAETAPLAAEAAGHGGCAMGIAGLIRLMPLHRARGKCSVPLDLLQAAGLTPESFLAGDNADGVRAAVEMMAALAQEHYGKFAVAAAALPASLRPALLPVALTPAHLGKVKADKPFDEARPLSDLRRQWILMRRAARGW
ncbi:phytoene/squalene synthase family protein [Tianweitania sp. BSSL-BM11]|uniref:Phytoene/squalene synthase family protein n=1 Tax=Tianweitania aestuarii TaxID=2814886 RepID=A0ABS5RUI5_9HYPH|nr:phytoene/squalene synthase family protein [Tianweitania aestuarii]MBS9720664.1 phytoene/squalene synthase family protein [Tianweitania aestuarii]